MMIILVDLALEDFTHFLLLKAPVMGQHLTNFHTLSAVRERLDCHVLVVVLALYSGTLTLQPLIHFKALSALI